MKPILQQAWRAATLDRRAFGEWIFSSSANGDAALIVIGIAIVRWVTAMIQRGVFSLDVVGLINEIISTLASWVFLAVASWFAGTRLFGGVGDWQTVLRLQGLAYLPNVLVVLVLLGGPFAAWAPEVGTVWYLAAAVVGTSVALSLKLRDAVLSVLIGAAIVVAVRTLLSGTFAGVGAAFSSIN
ncbi:MAG: hypothetical protein ACFCVC_07395 [Acidimicrobiia bacterium]